MYNKVICHSIYTQTTKKDIGFKGAKVVTELGESVQGDYSEFVQDHSEYCCC